MREEDSMTYMTFLPTYYIYVGEVLHILPLALLYTLLYKKLITGFENENN